MVVQLVANQFTRVRFSLPAPMTIEEAKKWVKAWKKSGFSCFVPNQVGEAIQVLQEYSGVAQLAEQQNRGEKKI